jgi:hypothetical protein
MAVFYKKEFLFGDKVVIQNTDPFINGATGVVVGIASAEIVDIYIVQMDSYPNKRSKWSCFTFPECCLKRI